MIGSEMLTREIQKGKASSLIRVSNSCSSPLIILRVPTVAGLVRLNCRQVERDKQVKSWLVGLKFNSFLLLKS